MLVRKISVAAMNVVVLLAALGTAGGAVAASDCSYQQPHHPPYANCHVRSVHTGMRPSAKASTLVGFHRAVGPAKGDELAPISWSQTTTGRDAFSSGPQAVAPSAPPPSLHGALLHAMRMAGA